MSALMFRLRESTNAGSLRRLHTRLFFTNLVGQLGRDYVMTNASHIHNIDDDPKQIHNQSTVSRHNNGVTFDEVVMLQLLNRRGQGEEK